VESLALTPDGRTLVSGDDRGKVRIWPSAAADKIQQAEVTGLYRRATQNASDGRMREAAALLTHLMEQRDDVDLRASRAEAYAELGAWDEAAADLAHVLEKGATNYRPWYELALTQLMQSDEVAYRKTCAGMLERFAATTDSTAAEFVCWTNALRPVGLLIPGCKTRDSPMPHRGGIRIVPDDEVG
jgi:hypothetical protein